MIENPVDQASLGSLETPECVAAWVAAWDVDWAEAKVVGSVSGWVCDEEIGFFVGKRFR